MCHLRYRSAPHFKGGRQKNCCRFTHKIGYFRLLQRHVLFRQWSRTLRKLGRYLMQRFTPRQDSGGTDHDWNGRMNCMILIRVCWSPMHACVSDSAAQSNLADTAFCALWCSCSTRIPMIRQESYDARYATIYCSALPALQITTSWDMERLV